MGRTKSNNFTEMNDVWVGTFELEVTRSILSTGCLGTCAGIYFCVSFCRMAGEIDWR
jgi:hypothetical protein